MVVKFSLCIVFTFCYHCYTCLMKLVWRIFSFLFYALESFSSVGIIWAFKYWQKSLLKPSGSSGSLRGELPRIFNSSVIIGLLNFFMSSGVSFNILNLMKLPFHLDFRVYCIELDKVVSDYFLKIFSDSMVTFTL